MSIEIKVPTLPESVSDAVVVSWYKQPGDVVRRDETLVDIETDKVVLEVPATSDGVLKEILQNEGATVVAGQALGVLEERDISTLSPAVSEKVPQEAESAGKTEVEISPSARRMIVEQGLDAGVIEGTGKGGRILKEDVQQFLERQHPPPTEKVPEVTAATGPVEALASQDRPEKRVPMTRLRARIAERLVEAQHTAAILTTFNEVNMQPVMDLRAKYKDRFEKEHGVRLGFMSLFVKSCVESLKRYPAVNASIDGNDIVYHGYFDIGVAVSSPRGLVVPVLRNAEHMSLAEIETAINSYAQKAKANELSIEDITGGTFTISNGGVFGSLLSTPILNPPQSGILGMHKIQERPVVENGEIVVRPMMYLALSYDHRIIDGREAVQFLVSIKDLLEDPARILLGI